MYVLQWSSAMLKRRTAKRVAQACATGSLSHGAWFVCWGDADTSSAVRMLGALRCPAEAEAWHRRWSGDSNGLRSC